MQRLARVLVAAAAAVLAVAGPGLAQKVDMLGPNESVGSGYNTGDWIIGQATFLDGTTEWKELTAPYRRGGVASWGVLYGNSCGFVDRRKGVQQTDADLPFPIDQAGAISTTSFPTSAAYCGQCYEVRCRDGFVLRGGQTPYEPVGLQNLTSGQPLFKIAPAVNYHDEQGRVMPQQAIAEMDKTGIMYTVCWDNAPTVFIHIVDACPCEYCPKGHICHQQGNCCAPTPTMDLSFWAFDKLAHPAHGIIGIEWRPVDCATRKPLDLRQGSKAWPIRDVYTDQSNGWAWYTFLDSEKSLIVKMAGVNLSPAACMTVSDDGGMAFECLECVGTVDPFKGATALSLWVRMAGGGPNYMPVQGAAVPDVKVYLSKSEDSGSTGSSGDTGCRQSPTLRSYTPAQQQGAWSKFTLPLSDFQCGDIADQLNKITIQAIPSTSKSTSFCVDNIQISSAAS